MSLSGIIDSLRQEQTSEYNDKAPNQIPSWGMAQGVKIPSNVLKSVKTYDPSSKNMVNDFVNIGSYFRPPVNSKYIEKTTAECKKRSQSGWQSMVDGNIPHAVCGYVYKSPPTTKSPYPQVSDFVANINNQPPPNYKMPPGSTYYTNMYEAGKKVNGDICRALTSCDAVNDPPFNGLCGYATDLAHGIPVFNGRPIYREEGLYAPPSTIVTNKDSCPKPTPQELEEEDILNQNSEVPIISPSNCYRDKESKQLRRECLIQQVKNAGCSDKGSLFRALSEGSDTNYGSKLQGVKAYQEFQTRAFLLKKPQLNDHLIKTGFGTINNALRNFNQLQRQAVNTAEKSAYSAAARDLCLNAGELDNYDICNDLLPGQITSNIPLECFQKFFRKAGGTPNGKAYPTLKNIGIIKSAYRIWGQYTSAIQTGVSMLDSKSFEKRKGAFMSLMGVELKQGGASSLNFAEPFTVGSSCQISEERCTNRSTNPSHGSTGRDIAVFRGLPLKGCKEKCCNDRRCKYYTFGDFGDGSMCWLKDGTCNSEPAVCKITSGTKA